MLDRVRVAPEGRPHGIRQELARLDRRKLEVMKRNTILSGSLLLVLTSLVFAGLACYSGQAGIFELTPFHTITPLPVAHNSRFQVLEVVLAPQEPGKSFFHLTVNPEPLQTNLMNSKTACQGDSSARILYVGENDKGEIYDLVDCVGSVGWTAENRLAGPLKFSAGDRAMVLVPQGEAAVNMLDDQLNPQPPNPLQTCDPETMVSVNAIQAADPTQKGTKDLFYQITCPTSSGPLKGWVVDSELFGPLEVTIGDRALAVASSAADTTSSFQLANEPAPLTPANTVQGTCAQGSVLEAKDAKLVDGTVFYQVACGTLEGWVEQSRLVGPLLFDPGMAVMIYVPSIPVFADELPASQAGGNVSAGQATVEPTANATESAANPEQRKVVQYTPPLYLTNKPGAAVPTGSSANVVGECLTNTTARVEEYGASSGLLYDRIQCSQCTQTETDENGQTTCTASESHDGWVPQSSLQGPLDFVVGDQVTVKSSSKSIETGDDKNQYIRLPANISGAQLIGQFTQFNGRCSLDQGLQISGVLMEKARTSNNFSFYYQVTCTGQPAVTKTVTVNNQPKPQVTYETGQMVQITGILSADDLQALNK